MRLPRYPEYKGSSSEWVDAIPAHWNSTPCRAIVVEQSVKNEGAENQDYLSVVANVGVMPYAEKGDVGNKKPEDLSKCKKVEVGDLVINSMNYGIGSYGLSGYTGVCSPVYIVLRPRPEIIESRFAFRVFENKAFQTYAQSFGNGILEHRAAINWDILKSINIGLPPIQEQKAILAFLDRETAKIDALIAEQEKLITLLAEKRQATISYAVTKGLNPDAPMKDSGVAWLGEVPAHWLLGQLKNFIRQKPGAIKTGPFGSHLTSAEMQEGVVKVYNQRSVIDNDFIDGENYISQEKFEQLSSFQTIPGDVLVTTRGTIGRAAILPANADLGILHPCLLRVQVDDLILHREFLVVLIQDSHLMKTQIALNSNATTIDVIYSETMASLFIPLPPLAEQKAILHFLNAETSRLDALTAEATRGIALLKERRSALISAAVTGKIDVRGEVTA